MSSYQGDSIFWVEVDRIKPNPFQPRRTFEEAALMSLAESIRQYGVLQPLTVTRKEIERPGEGIFVEYELVAGERRLRASKLAGIQQVPVVIRTTEDSDRVKLELAIIENLQREDLNAVDRAEAFARLVNEFGLKHLDVGKRVGRSREYVSNTLRILALPAEMIQALRDGAISEGHTRPLLMLSDRPEEQQTLFKDITTRRVNVRDAEQLARRIAVDRARTKQSADVVSLEKELSEKLGTRVRIEKNEAGGKVTIDFFSPEDLTNLCLTLVNPAAPVGNSNTESEIAMGAPEIVVLEPDPALAPADAEGSGVAMEVKKSEDEDLYSISNFTV
ncbi:ParB/RepB/Spo0J family partition protein [Candidatus Kaiserbacteria bacterium]|nr:ParB/RepB/Spo0J family partition protein [Candidatus Kaiserbacteria bacterium]